MRDGSRKGSIVDELNGYGYATWDVAWIKACDLREHHKKSLCTQWGDPETAQLLADWFAGKGSGLEVLDWYTNCVLCGQLPEDSLWGQLCSDYDEEGMAPRWRETDEAPHAIFERILRFNYFSGEGYRHDPSSGRVWEERPATDAELQWYTRARGFCFELAPLDGSTFFVPRLREGEIHPWDVPQALIGVSREFLFLVVHHSDLWRADYEAAVAPGNGAPH